MKKVLVEQGGEMPPALVGATLSCMEVALHAKGLKSGQAASQAEWLQQQETADVTRLAEDAQFGLFLFGGEDQDNNPTSTLLVFYVQERRWRKPSSGGRTPSKRSRHSASVVIAGQRRQQQLLIFGGVGATNAVSLLDSVTNEWSHPPTCSKPGEKEKAKRRARKEKKSEESVSDSLLPCARFGHSAAVDERRLLVFGGADFKGPLDDLYELNMAVTPMEWSRPETRGMPPPPSAKHACAVCRDHMIILSGEKEWGGHLWALQLRHSLTWFRSTLPSFPLLGTSGFTIQPYVTPRPHKRAEIFIFGGYMEAVGGRASEVCSTPCLLSPRGRPACYYPVDALPVTTS